MHFFNKESGRTMVEMLGVLMIFGFLSIVGIAGYEELKNKWRVTETLTAIQKVHSVARSKGRSTNSYKQNLPLPNGILLIESKADGSMRIYYDEEGFSAGLIEDLERKLGLTITKTEISTEEVAFSGVTGEATLPVLEFKMTKYTEESD